MNFTIRELVPRDHFVRPVTALSQILQRWDIDYFLENLQNVFEQLVHAGRCLPLFSYLQKVSLQIFPYSTQMWFRHSVSIFSQRSRLRLRGRIFERQLIIFGEITQARQNPRKRRFLNNSEISRVYRKKRFIECKCQEEAIKFI